MDRARTASATLVLFVAAGCGESLRETSSSADGNGGGTRAGGASAVGGTETVMGGGGGANGGRTGGAGGSSGGAGAVTGAAAGVGAAAGAGAAAGEGGSGPTACVTATVTLSTVIPTVATVTLTTTLTDVTQGRIEFGPSAGGASMVALVDLTQPSYVTHLVGMKPNTSYVYSAWLGSATESCVTVEQTFVTGSLPNAPAPTKEVLDPAKHREGFLIVVGTWLDGGENVATAYIIDQDGTVVWVAPAGSVPPSPARAHLSWDARRLIVMASNQENTDEGAITTIAMDGSDVRSFPDVTKAHHDFAAIPGGIATILWSGEGSGDVSCSLVEILDMGSSRTVVSNFEAVYDPASEAAFQTNSVHYHDADESYTVGDRDAGLYVKVTRDGELVWQLGGKNPKGPTFSGVMPWGNSYGHHLTIADTFALFGNSLTQNPNDPSYVVVYDLNTAAMGATKRHEFTVAPSTVFGDVQLVGGAGGNFLVTTRNRIVEYTPTGIEVMTIDAPNLGYTEYRRSLYGAPEY